MRNGEKKEAIPVYTLDGADRLEHPFRLVELTPRKEETYDYSRPHRHAYYEIFYFESGGGEHEIDFTTGEIVSPAIHFVSPGQIHRVARSAESHGCVILFTDEFYYLNLANRAILREMPMLRGDPQGAMIELGPEDHREVDAVIRMLRQEDARKGEHRDDALRSILNLLLITVLRVVERKGLTVEETGDSRLIRRLRDAIDEHFHSIHSVSAYANLLNVTPGHLNDTARRETGMTASSLIHERILLEARRLLAHSDQSVKEVAYALGFDDPSYFTRFFRERSGEAPGEFRERFSSLNSRS